MSSHLAICDEDGLPLWRLEPTMENISQNELVVVMTPFVPCIVILERHNGTCIVAYDGVVAFAVTECLYELL